MRVTPPHQSNTKATLAVAFVFVGDAVRMRIRVPGSRRIAQRCDDAGPAGGPEYSEGRDLRNKRRASLPAASTIM